MENHIVKILTTDQITHNVKRFVVEKPTGYTFLPGQATDVSINKPGMETELRPFTFTSLPADDTLEFIIKIYKGRDGVTEKLEDLDRGDELILHEVFGAIDYRGPGLFIAGGAGITPFIAILRHLNLSGQLAGNTLLFANHSENDVILNEELTSLLRGNILNVIKSPADSEIPKQQIDLSLLSKHLCAIGAYYYVCGPDQFTIEIVAHLKDLGVAETSIITEQ